MRPVLSLGICLLLLLVFGRTIAHFVPESHAVRARSDGGLSIVAVGKGPLLPATTLPGGDEELDDLILVGDLILTIPERPAGLRMVTLTPELEFAEHRVFDLAGTAQHGEDLLWVCARKPIHSVLIFVSYGSIRPRPEIPAPLVRGLSNLFVELGAETNPIDPGTASWAMISVRLESGWVKLAEAYATGQGVALNFTLDPDLSVYEGHHGEVARSAETKDAPVPLDIEISSAEISPKAHRVRGARVGNVPRDAIDARPLWVRNGTDLASFVRWRGVQLREGAVFKSGIGIRDGSWEKSNGARFSLLINGEVEYEETLLPEPAPPTGWHDWEVDLSEYGGQTIDLELRVDPLGNAADDRAFWGFPKLVFR